jgi:hypothetical protein
VVGGYTARAIVADSHPIHHPAPTSQKTRCVRAGSIQVTTPRRTIQTMAQPMLYAV